VELVGFATCNGCPGGNVAYVPQEMKNNGADVIHLATGLIVGYPPCPRISYFTRFIKEKYGMDVVVGTPNSPEILYNPPEAWVVGLGCVERADSTYAHR